MVSRSGVPALRTSRRAGSITSSPNSIGCGARGRRASAAAPPSRARPARAARTAWSGSRRRRARARSRRSVSSPSAVIMITGSSERSLIQRHSDSPSMPGSIRSRTTRLGISALEQVAGVVAVAGLERAVARLPQVAHDDVAHRRFIVDDEHGAHRRHCSPRRSGGHVNSSLRPRAVSESRNGRRRAGRGYGPLDPDDNGGGTHAVETNHRGRARRRDARARRHRRVGDDDAHRVRCPPVRDGRARGRQPPRRPPASSAGRSTSRP